MSQGQNTIPSSTGVSDDIAAIIKAVIAQTSIAPPHSPIVPTSPPIAPFARRRLDRLIKFIPMNSWAPPGFERWEIFRRRAKELGVALARLTVVAIMVALLLGLIFKWLFAWSLWIMPSIAFVGIVSWCALAWLDPATSWYALMAMRTSSKIESSLHPLPTPPTEFSLDEADRQHGDRLPIDVYDGYGRVRVCSMTVAWYSVMSEREMFAWTVKANDKRFIDNARAEEASYRKSNPDIVFGVCEKDGLVLRHGDHEVGTTIHLITSQGVYAIPVTVGVTISAWEYMMLREPLTRELYAIAKYEEGELKISMVGTADWNTAKQKLIGV